MNPLARERFEAVLLAGGLWVFLVVVCALPVWWFWS